MLPAHVRYQVKADNSTVAVSSQESFHASCQCRLPCPAPAPAVFLLPGSRGPGPESLASLWVTLGCRAALLPASDLQTGHRPLTFAATLSSPCPAHCTLPAPYYPRPVLPRSIGHGSQSPDLRQPAPPRSAPDRRHLGLDPRGPSPRLFRGCEAGAGCSKRGHMGAEMTGGHALAGAVLQHWY